jgi:hypothetical protein
MLSGRAAASIPDFRDHEPSKLVAIWRFDWVAIPWTGLFEDVGRRTLISAAAKIIFAVSGTSARDRLLCLAG